MTTTYLESSYRHQAIVFRRFSSNEGITVEKIFHNLGLRDLNFYFASIINNEGENLSYPLAKFLETNIFDFIDIDNLKPIAMILGYNSKSNNNRHYAATIYAMPIAKQDGTLYIRMTYIKPGDVADDRKTVYSKSEPLVVSFLIVYDFDNPEEKIKCCDNLSKSVKEHLDSNNPLNKDELEFIHGCYEIDSTEILIQNGQYYYSRERYADSILQFERVFNTMKYEMQNAEQSIREQFALVCMYLGKNWEKLGVLEKSYYYLDLATFYDYIYQPDLELVMKQFLNTENIPTKIDFKFILKNLLDINPDFITRIDKIDYCNDGFIQVVHLSKPDNNLDKSLIANTFDIIINVNKVIDTNGKYLCRVDITMPHYRNDNDKFYDEKYNIPRNISFVLPDNFEAISKRESEEIEQLFPKCSGFVDEKLYIYAIFYLTIIVEKLKKSYHRDDNRKLMYFKALGMIVDAMCGINNMEKSVFYARLLMEDDSEKNKERFIHSLIDADDPRAVNYIKNVKDKTPKMQLYIHNYECFAN